jgi:hypothetical protein
MTTIYLVAVDAETARPIYMLAEVDTHNMITKMRFPDSLDGLDASSFMFICYQEFYNSIPSNIKIHPAPELESILYTGPVYCLLPKECYGKSR